MYVSASGTSRTVNMAKERTRNVRGVDIWPFLLLILSVLLTADVGAVHITHLDIPAVALSGDTVHMGCHYQQDREGGSLYSLKWYKGVDEIFRHQPGMPTGGTTSKDCHVNSNIYQVPGVNVDCWESSEREVVLKGVSPASSGTYKCEVISEQPYFTKNVKNATLTVFSERVLPPALSQVEVPPLETPRDHRSFTCVARNTEYNPSLTWLVNGHPVNQTWVTDIDQRRSGLVVPVRYDYFPGGVMLVDCLAALGAKHREASQLKLRRQDYLTAQEYHSNTGTKTASTPGALVLGVLLWGYLSGWGRMVRALGSLLPSYSRCYGVPAL